ncbi:MAG: hypothetical protein ABIO63_10220 [Casimicrobiaceae bacterium]
MGPVLILYHQLRLLALRKLAPTLDRIGLAGVHGVRALGSVGLDSPIGRQAEVRRILSNYAAWLPL